MARNAAPAASPMSLETFIDQRAPVLERALIARFGMEIGREAAADARACACEHWDQLAPMENPAGYLFRVGRTTARRQGRRHRPSVLHEHSVTSLEPINIDLQRALMHLRPDQRVAIALTRGFGHTHSEVAGVMGYTTSNVGSHVSRGQAHLRS